MSLKTKAYKFTALSLLLAPMALSTFQGVTVMAEGPGTEEPAPTPIPEGYVRTHLHKLLNTDNKDVQNTGKEMTPEDFYGEDATEEDMVKLPGVTFEAFDFSAAYYFARSTNPDWSAQKIFDYLNSCKYRITNGVLEFKEPDMDEFAPLPDNIAAVSKGTVTTNGSGIATIDLPEKTTVNVYDKEVEAVQEERDAIYLFLETDAPAIVTQTASPIILGLPAYVYDKETGKYTDEKLSEIHLYPKNESQLGTLYADKVIRSIAEKDGVAGLVDISLDGATFVVHKKGTDIHNYDENDAIFLGYADPATGVRDWVTREQAEPFTTSNGGKLLIPGLAKGDYRLSETSKADGDNAYAGNASVFNREFTIDLGVDEGKTYDVEFTGDAELVNDDIKIIKDNTSASYQYGEVIEYTAETLIPGGMNYEIEKDGVLSPYYTEYSFTDTHNQWLVLDESSIVIKANGNVIDETDYTLTYDNTDPAKPKFKILFNTPKATLGQYADKKLEIAYNMSIKGDVPIENGAPADVDFINEITAKSNFDEGTDEGEKVYTGGRKFIKVDGHSGAELAGAKFNISDAEEDGNLLYVDATGNYKFLASATEGYTLVELTSDEDGKFEIKGLKYGTYYLQEIAVPDSTYILPDGKFEFEVARGSYDLSHEVLNEEQKIKNFSKGTLPSTGGMGTIVFFLVGAVAMTGVVAVSRKKKA